MKNTSNTRVEKRKLFSFRSRSKKRSLLIGKLPVLVTREKLHFEDFETASAWASESLVEIKKTAAAVSAGFAYITTPLVATCDRTPCTVLARYDGVTTPLAITELFKVWHNGEMQLSPGVYVPAEYRKPIAAYVKTKPKIMPCHRASDTPLIKDAANCGFSDCLIHENDADETIIAEKKVETSDCGLSADSENLNAQHVTLTADTSHSVVPCKSERSDSLRSIRAVFDLDVLKIQRSRISRSVSAAVIDSAEALAVNPLTSGAFRSVSAAAVVFCPVKDDCVFKSLSTELDRSVTVDSVSVKKEKITKENVYFKAEHAKLKESTNFYTVSPVALEKSTQVSLLGDYPAISTITGLPPTQEESPYSSTDSEEFAYSPVGISQGMRIPNNDPMINMRSLEPSFRDICLVDAGIYSELQSVQATESVNGSYSLSERSRINTTISGCFSKLISSSVTDIEDTWETIDLSDNVKIAQKDAVTELTEAMNVLKADWFTAVQGWTGYVSTATKTFAKTKSD